MKQKKNRSFTHSRIRIWEQGIRILVVLAIGFIFPACSMIYISPLGKPPVETSPEETLPPSEQETQPEPSYPPEEVPHEIEEYEIEPPPKKEVPRIGAKTETPASRESTYMLAGIVRLMDKAKDQMEQENFDHAFATTERAIRIDDANPKLWSLLAEIQLKRGNVLQAEQLANKSNLLAKGDKMLQAKNWRIIAETFHRRGRTAEANHASRKAKKLEEQ